MVWSQPPYHETPSFGKLVVIGLAASSSSSSSSSSPSSSSSSSSSPIRLQAPHPELKPSERLAALGEICDDDDSIIDGLNLNEWDVYGDFHKSSEESFLRHFESTVASEFGFDDAVFMPSGVICQSVALLIHHENRKQQQEQHEEMKTPQNKKFACHPTSHLLLHENEGFRYLCGFDVAVIKENQPNSNDSNDHNKGLGLDGEPLRYDHLNDFQQTLGGWDEDISTLIVELPHRELGGKITPWEDIVKIRQFLEEKQVAFHCDGARIFEATTGYDNRSLRELSEPFDSMYISFYKGLGGLAGGMLLGNTAFCDKARTMLRQFGGNLYTLLPYIASAWDGYQQNWVLPNKTKDKSIENGDVSASINLLSFQEKKEKLVRIVSELSSIDDSFCRIARFEPRVPHVSMIHLYLKPTVEECNKVRDEILAEDNVCIFHRLRSVDPQDSVAKTNGFQSILELSVGQSNGSIPDETWISSWRKFSERLSYTVTTS